MYDELVRQPVLKMSVAVVNANSARKALFGHVGEKKGAYVCLSNVHMCMEAFDSSDFCDVVNSADIVLPDGKPISIAQRMLGHASAEQTRGENVMKDLCSYAAANGFRVGLYGGSSDTVLHDVANQLNDAYPGLLISYKYSPPFRALNSDEELFIQNDINRCNVDILFVGIGCPKQEIWMAKNKPFVNSLMLGVGAAFDFIAGSKKHAPLWMQNAGLEWLFRLFSEPKRLWKRYLKQNPRFIYYFLQQWLFKKDFTKEGPKDV
jgi:N-acetylglucosaminyldiphosphoundecaprenol N-acetyl-beta-D-mannosaminyltransferase